MLECRYIFCIVKVLLKAFINSIHFYLLQYSLCLLIFFLLEMGIAILGFVFPHNMQATLEESFTDKIIHTYRDDPDLQNLIDFAQKEVLILLKKNKY